MPELVIEMLDAGAGDTFIVHTYEDSGHVWTAVVDGGPARTADRGLKTLIWQVALPSLSPKRASAFIDLLAVTHIDSDHIGGAVQLVRDTFAAGGPSVVPFHFETVWYNSFTELTHDHTLTGSGQVRLATKAELSDPWKNVEDPARGIAMVASINEGQDLRDLLSKMGLGGNPPFGGLISLGHAASWPSGPRITIVGPSRDDIDALQRFWMAEVNGNMNPSHKALYAAAALDQSVPNSSSLVFLLEHAGRTALFTGDARGDRIVAQLEGLGYLKDGPLEVDALKVPHHGSERRCTDSLFRSVKSKHYLFSGDGSNGNPSAITAERLRQARRNDRYVVWMTHDVPSVTAVFGHERGVEVVIRPQADTHVTVTL